MEESFDPAIFLPVSAKVAETTMTCKGGERLLNEWEV